MSPRTQITGSEGSKDAIRLMKYSSLLNEMEHAIDKCEDLMNSLESIMLKNA